MTDDLERRLRTSLSGAALPLAPDSLHEALDRLPNDAGPIGTGGHGLRLAWVMPVLVVVVVLALIAAWLPGGLLGPAGPTASPRGSPSPVPSTGPDITWTKVASMPHALINSVVAVPGGGYLAVGSMFDVQGAFWSSVDGTSWSPSGQTDPALAGSLFDQIVALPHGGFLLVGEAAALDGQCGGGALGCNPVNQLRMWTSTDGQAWQALTATSLLAFGRSESIQVASGPAGLIASGVVAPVTGELSSSMWTSPDGTTWTQASQFHQAFPTAAPDWVGALTGGFVATGLRDVNAASPDADGGAWFSKDGATWSPANLPAGTPHIGGLKTAAGGALAIPVGAAAPGSVYETTDGSSWRVAPPLSIPFGLEPNQTHFLSDGSRIVALGAARSWTSTDASSWQALSETNAPPADGFVTGTFSATGLVVVVGSDIWFGSWTEPPPTTIPTPPVASSPPASSPSATTMPAETKVTVPLGGTHAVTVTIYDQSGLLTGARPLDLPSGAQIPASYGDLDIAAWNPGGKPSSEVWLYWGGVICDVASRLVIGPGAASMTVAEGPRPLCDASNDGRGIVLTFRAAVDARSIAVKLIPAAPFSVQAAGLLDQGHGWALTNQQLAVTSDKGSSWHDVTPLDGFGAGAGNPLGVTFTDPQHGWVAINETFTSPNDPGYGRIVIWRTTDGGASWARTELPKAVINHYGEIMPRVQFDFLDATHGFAFLSGNLAKGANDSDLFYTSDGGQTWSDDRPTGSGNVGIEGNVAFATTNDGVIVNADVGSSIAVTHDGGRTWADAVMAMPSGSAAAQLFFGQPVFADGRTGVVAVDFQGDSGSVTHMYRTIDAGSSWTDVEAFPTGFYWVSVIDQQHWVAISDSVVRHTDDGGATWTQTAAVPPTSHDAGPQFADDNDGWWLAGDNLTAALYATSDGGATWKALAP